MANVKEYCKYVMLVKKTETNAKYGMPEVKRHRLAAGSTSRNHIINYAPGNRFL